MRKWHGDVAAVLLLTLTFFLSAMMVLISGAGVYQSMTDRNNNTLACMTAEQYLMTKVRHSGGDIQVLGLDGQPVEMGPVLRCREMIDGEAWNQLIYVHDGCLYELLCGLDFEFEPGDGDWVLDISNLEFRQAAGGVWAVADGREFYISGRELESR